MRDYAFDFSFEYEPWTSAIMDLDYGLCKTCGKMVPSGLDRCYECEFYKPHISQRTIRIKTDIKEAIDILEKVNNNNNIGGNE